MITKEEAYEIAKKFIGKKNSETIEIKPIEMVSFTEGEDIYLKGEESPIIDDTWVVPYYEQWGADERSIYIIISATKGEIYYLEGPHGIIDI